MKPNSGIYTIKIKINKIENYFYCSNIFGITSDRYDNNNDEKMNKNNKDYAWHTDSNNYIDVEDDNALPNGLYCGWSHNGRKKNIFRKNTFVYQSKNVNYKHRLPGLQDGDTIILSYNSALNELSFNKENDNDKLSSFIKNLPKNMKFYWFVGHSYGKPMSISIVD